MNGKARTTVTTNSEEAAAWTQIQSLLVAEAGAQIKNYCVGLVLNGEFIGSGTLVTWDGNFGVLTAEHVINNPDSQRLRCDFSSSSTQKLQLIVACYPIQLQFELAHLFPITLGGRTSDEFGPDIAVVVLPSSSPQLSEIKARSSFWDIPANAFVTLKAVLSADTSAMVAGHPGESLTYASPSLGFKEVYTLQLLTGATFVCNYFEHGGYDYIEIQSECDSSSAAPKNYGGMSGGGLWLVTSRHRRIQDIAREPSLNITLAGVIFYDTDRSAAEKPIRCHGLKTIYNHLAAKLRECCPPQS